MTLHFLPEEAEVVARAGFERAPCVGTRVHGGLSGRLSENTFYRRFTKRLLDISLTLILMPIAAPLVMLMAVLVMLDGYNPFYSQMRVGHGGRIFRMWKLRTMVHDADARLENYLSENPAARREWKTTQKLKDDPRVTRVGWLLRKSSLDELPQLWNVLTGSMSLVGPRPMMECQRKDYFGLAYFNLRPGITGLWQISDRNECEFAARARYDDLYDQSVSFGTDLWILFRTAGAVLRGTGY